jgi:hypothetical protein
MVTTTKTIASSSSSQVIAPKIKTQLQEECKANQLKLRISTNLVAAVYEKNVIYI